MHRPTVGSIYDLTIDGAATRSGAHCSHGHIAHLFGHESQPDFSLILQTESVVFQKQSAIDAESLEGTVVAIQAVGIDPAARRCARRVIRRETPVIAIELTTERDSIQSQIVVDGPFVV